MPDLKEFFVFEKYFDVERVVHSLKTALACLIGFAFINIFPSPSAQWLIITILVVMCAQIYVGSTLQKSYMRFIGTFVGSSLAIITLYFFGNSVAATIVVIMCSAIFFSYLATGSNQYSDAGTLGVVTVAIILIGHNATVITGFGRFFEISLGIVIATIVSQFIFPIHARNHLRRNQAATIRELKRYYEAFFLKKSVEELTKNEIELDETIVQSLLIQRKLATEARRELLGETFDVDYFKQSLWCEKEVLRSIFFMHFTYNASEVSKKIISNIELLRDFHNSMGCALEKLANCIEKKESTNILLPSITPFKDIFEQAVKNISFQDGVYINSYFFCMEVLVARIEKLVNLVIQFR